MQTVVATLAIATSVLAVLAGLDRWLLPSIRQRQYGLLTQMRDDEADPARQASLDEARTKATAVQVAAFWMPTSRMLHVPAATIVLSVLMYYTPVLIAADQLEENLFPSVSIAATFIASALFLAFFELASLYSGYVTYVQRMGYVRQYLQHGSITDTPPEIPKSRLILLAVEALLLMWIPAVIGLYGSPYSPFDGLPDAEVASFVVTAAIAAAAIGRHLYLVERTFMRPGDLSSPAARPEGGAVAEQPDDVDP